MHEDTLTANVFAAAIGKSSNSVIQTDNAFFEKSWRLASDKDVWCCLLFELFTLFAKHSTSRSVSSNSAKDRNEQPMTFERRDLAMPTIRSKNPLTRVPWRGWTSTSSAVICGSCSGLQVLKSLDPFLDCCESLCGITHYHLARTSSSHKFLQYSF